MFDGDVPGLLALVVPVGAVPVRRGIVIGRKSLRGVDIHGGGREVIRRCGSRNQGVVAEIGAAWASWNVGVVEGIVLEPEIQGRIVAGRLQQQRQWHGNVVDAVRAADYRIVVKLVGYAQARRKIMMNGPKQVRRVSNGIRRRPR